MRLRKVKNVYEKLAKFPDSVIVSDENTNLGAVFPNNQPLVVEVGSGKGQFITQLANLHPEYNFLGLEKEPSIVYKAVNKQEIPSNLKFCVFDASKLDQAFKPASIAQLFLTFSDPWPKARHEKRRLTYQTFLKQYQTILKHDGSLILKTDNRKFFEYSLQSFISNGWIIIKLSLDLHADNPDEIKTEYEERFIELEEVIYYLEVKYGNETL